MKSTFKIQQPPGVLPPTEVGVQVGALRRLVRESLDDLGLSCIADSAALVVSELVTNALVHSGGQEGILSLSLRDDRLRIEVHDGVPSYRPVYWSAGAADEHGRGLVLVNAIADDWRGSWGVSNNGASTWCELALAAS
ncbi:ATP-binding protein [Streptomyces sp. NPDC057654]|uniref:ATP-binding protein n=1 Tax=Streptomyces sp. NPDC057654 TaxID=3346196 RepID=UPI0036CBFEBC